MGKQLELFEREDRWVQRLWQTIPAGTRECVVVSQGKSLEAQAFCSD